MLLVLMKVRCVDAQVHLYCLLLYYYLFKQYNMHMCYIYDAGALWWTIYRILTAQMNDTYMIY